MALNQTLLNYRASQHCTTQTSAALLMLDRQMELPLDRLRAKGLSATVVTGSQAAVKVAVTTNQGQMKDKFDKRHKVRYTNIKVLEWVRVCTQTSRSSKMALFWSEPHQGVRRLGSATFPLSDGSRWHAIRFQKVPIPLTPTRGHWATEPNASAAQRVNSPLPWPEPVPPWPNQAPQGLQVREPPQLPGPDTPPLLQADGPHRPQPLLDCLTKMPRKCPSRRLWEADQFKQGLMSLPAYLEDYVTQFHE